MPRRARKDSQSCFYHVIVQGINKEYIFEKEEFILCYKKIILEKLKDANIKVLAYCIMNNHAHLLIYAEKSEYLSKFMQKINTKYSNYYNRIKKRVGYVFRDRFYSQSIMNEKQLLNCLKYIHMNPVKAKIIKTMDKYKYSSYNEFLNEKEIIDEEGIKLIFGDIKTYKEEFNKIHNNNLVV